MSSFTKVLVVGTLMASRLSERSAKLAMHGPMITPLRAPAMR